MQKSILLSGDKFQITIQRLCHQLIENHHLFTDSVIIGIQPRGIYLGRRIVRELQRILSIPKVPYGELDITFYRDDFRMKGSVPHIANSTHIDFIIEDKNVILIDDVLWTGRTIRSSLDAIQSFGRPKKVELLVLVDRRFARHLPIEPDYVGLAIDSINSQKVVVSWQEVDQIDQIELLNNDSLEVKPTGKE